MLGSMLCSMLRWVAFWVVYGMLGSKLCLTAYCAAYRVWRQIVQHIVFGSVWCYVTSCGEHFLGDYVEQFVVFDARQHPKLVNRLGKILNSMFRLEASWVA